ncbi:MAG: ImmA/IrrE family metallo-endopeptidase [Myxococcales bacterium]|nr:ImmA/IrrE family metallo-endopeptidase [Myxococcales bacterium]
MSRLSHDTALLDAVFGPGEGTTPEARAAGSTRQFVRGLDLLTFDESPRAKGRRLKAHETLEVYGFDKLAEVASEGSAVLCATVEAAGHALRERRTQLNLTVRNVAAATQLPIEVIEALEASRRRPVREYERVARVLGLDERMVSFRREPQGNSGVAIRLREMHDSRTALSGPEVLAFAEAAWVAMTQIRLEARLALVPRFRFDVEPFYGNSRQPAYRVGHELADQVREALGLAEAPLTSIRDLLERELRIPVIQVDLGKWIAGATVETSGRRAIVVNLTGRNQNAFMRRSTLAHELCHILFDPQQQLRDLRVDEYADLDKRADQVTDPVEQRANAFAVQLLAPQRAAKALFQATRDDPLGIVMDRFGISFTAARFQIWNALQRSVPLDSLQTGRFKPEDDWEAREVYTTAFHPIRSLADHPARAGRFSAVVLRSVEAGHISWDTACEWLFCSEAELLRAAPAMYSLYPDLFSTDPSSRAVSTAWR